MDVKEAIRICNEITETNMFNRHTDAYAIEAVLSELEKKDEEIKEYEKTLNVFDEREYRKKYLEEERAKRPNLLYPDADEIYERYFQQRAELEKKDKIIDEMAKYMAGGNSYMYGTPEGIKEDFTKKCEGK